MARRPVGAILSGPCWSSGWSRAARSGRRRARRLPCAATCPRRPRPRRSRPPRCPRCRRSAPRSPSPTAPRAPWRPSTSPVPTARALRADCATLTVPLDPAQPALGAVTLGVVRVGLSDAPGRAPLATRPPLLVLGDTATDPTARRAARLAAQVPEYLLSRYAIIGLDRRGTGADTLDCADPDARAALVDVDPVTVDATGLLERARAVVQACNVRARRPARRLLQRCSGGRHRGGAPVPRGGADVRAGHGGRRGRARRLGPRPPPGRRSAHPGRPAGPDRRRARALGGAREVGGGRVRRLRAELHGGRRLPAGRQPARQGDGAGHRPARAAADRPGWTAPHGGRRPHGHPDGTRRAHHLARARQRAAGGNGGQPGRPPRPGSCRCSARVGASTPPSPPTATTRRTGSHPPRSRSSRSVGARTTRCSAAASRPISWPAPRGRPGVSPPRPPVPPDLPPVAVIGTAAGPRTPVEARPGARPVPAVGRVHRLAGRGTGAFPRTLCVNSLVDNMLVDASAAGPGDPLPAVGAHAGPPYGHIGL